MDYLRSTANASAGAIFVICRHLGHSGAALSVRDLRLALRPLPELRSEDLREDADADRKRKSDGLASSLKVAEGIGLVIEDPAGWTLDPSVRREFAEATGAGSAWFRAELLRRINAESMASLKNKARPADLVLGMTWFLQQNPLKPLSSVYSNGAEQSLRMAGLDAVSNQEQWRPFRRWLLALGLARNVDVPGTKVTVADASTAIADQLGLLPSSGRADDWLAELRTHLPIFGAAPLLAALPLSRGQWNPVPPAVSLGLLKLERLGVLALESADDGRGVVTVGLGSNPRQVGVIRVTRAAA